MLIWMASIAMRCARSIPIRILLNLLLSCIAALQAPVIMMSQNRQAARDRVEVKNDYEVNLRAELQIVALHAKLDEARDKDLAKLAALLVARKSGCSESRRCCGRLEQRRHEQTRESVEAFARACEGATWWSCRSPWLSG
jgi:uncharacterized membrane protein